MPSRLEKIRSLERRKADRRSIVGEGMREITLAICARFREITR